MSEKARDEDFNQIKSELVGEVRGMRQDLNRMCELLNIHDRALYGNKVDTSGLVGDMKVIKDGRKHVLALWMTMIPVAAERVWSYLTGHIK